MTCPRCAAQSAVLTRLARDLAEARIALARIRDITNGVTAGDYREIRREIAAVLPNMERDA